jgi:hypothetical protein
MLIGQIGCYILMSSLKFVLDVGLNFFTGGAGRVLDAGMGKIQIAIKFHV